MRRDALVDALRDDPALRRVSHLIVRRSRDRWTLIVSYAGMSRIHPSDLGTDRPAGRDHVVSINMDAIPDGVSVRGWERDPDRVVALSEPAGDAKAAIHAAIGALAESGLLGSPLDVARHDPASVDAIAHDPWPRWHIRPGRPPETEWPA